MTIAIAVPMLVLAAIVEVFVWPHLLRLASPRDVDARDGASALVTTLCIVTGQTASTRPGDNMAATSSRSQTRTSRPRSSSPRPPCSWTSGPRGAVRAASSPRCSRRSRSERDDLRIVKLNVDENQDTAAQYQVLSIPTLILFKDGAEAKKVIGAYPKKRLEAELEPVLA